MHGRPRLWSRHFASGRSVHNLEQRSWSVDWGRLPWIPLSLRAAHRTCITKCAIAENAVGTNLRMDVVIGCEGNSP